MSLLDDILETKKRLAEKPVLFVFEGSLEEFKHRLFTEGAVKWRDDIDPTGIDWVGSNFVGGNTIFGLMIYEVKAVNLVLVGDREAIERLLGGILSYD